VSDLPFPHVEDRIETTGVKTDEEESIGRIGLNNTETMTQLFPSKMTKLSKILDQRRALKYDKKLKNDMAANASDYVIN